MIIGCVPNFIALPICRTQPFVSLGAVPMQTPQWWVEGLDNVARGIHIQPAQAANCKYSMLASKQRKKPKSVKMFTWLIVDFGATQRGSDVITHLPDSPKSEPSCGVWLRHMRTACLSLHLEYFFLPESKTKIKPHFSLSPLAEFGVGSSLVLRSSQTQLARFKSVMTPTLQLDTPEL